jgi:AcrR family transcriptional regulator
MSAVRKSKTKPKTRQRTKPLFTQSERTEAARAKIVEAAFRCIGTRGYSQTTLIDIAAVAGCSRELPRYHFGSKDNLLRVLLDVTHEEWRQALKTLIDRGIHGMEAVTLVTDGFIAIYQEDAAGMRGRLSLAFGAAEPGNAPLRAQVVAMQVEFVELFRQLIAGGPDLRSGHDPNALSNILFGTLRGIAYQWMTEPGSVDVTRVVGELKRLMGYAFA